MLNIFVCPVPFFLAAWLVFIQSYFSALDFQRFAVEQNIGYFSVRRFNDPAERLTGNIHSGGRIFLIKLFVIRQANRLEFIQS